MKNRVLPLFLALVLCLGVLTTGAMAADSHFVIENGVLIDYTDTGVGGDVVIPDGVTAIGDSAFQYCTGLTGVTIPDSVTSIGDYAFEECASLTGVTIPDSVTAIGQGAFYRCTGLTGVTIPDSVTSIGGSAFFDCLGLTSVTIPNSVTSIGDSAFWACGSLTSVTIPDSVTTIGAGAFYACTRLTSVTISNGDAEIGGRAFYSMDGEDDDPVESPLPVVIYAPAGGKVEAYCKANGITFAPFTVQPSNDPLAVDGVTQRPAVYKINDSNYIQLRDIAMMLSQTTAKFSVDYDGEKEAITITAGEDYAPRGDELTVVPTSNANAAISNDAVYINGKKADLTAYKIDGSNYFKIRDLGKALGFNVRWFAEVGAYIESDRPYTDD